MAILFSNVTNAGNHEDPKGVPVIEKITAHEAILDAPKAPAWVKVQPLSQRNWKPGWKENRADRTHKSVNLDYQTIVVCHDRNHERKLNNVCGISGTYSVQYVGAGGSYGRGLRILKRMQKNKLKMATKKFKGHGVHFSVETLVAEVKK